MTTDSELLSEIAEDYTVRLRGEDPPTIDWYVEKHPKLAKDIRKLLPSIQAMEQLGRREHSERKFERTTRRLAIAPDALLGDFKIIREIGRGGMGVVYEAEEQSLKRRVAIKILGPTMAGSPKQLARFQSEAKAVARLHHTNIVSVFGVGEHEGLYYYAMQLIEGLTLAEAIAVAEPEGTFVTHYGEMTQSALQDVAPDKVLPPTIAGDETEPDALPIEAKQRPQETGAIEVREALHAASRWTEIARLGAAVADALNYAHNNGVWHRDIKPSNLIIDNHGAIWITDFGLAQYEDREDVTATGDIVGTPRYMAPEQFDGKFDGRSDTYSLGMTIYEMLALRPAFETMGPQLIKQKTTSRPPAPRTINPEIPRDLETIVLKACAVDPSKRYVTPGELGADLRRFLEDRPIHARRITLRERFYRWAKRNPLVAGLGLLSIVLLTTLVAVFGVLSVQLSAEARKAELAYDSERRYRTEQTANLVTMTRIVDSFQDLQNRQMERVSNRMFSEPWEYELASSPGLARAILSDSDREYLADQLRFDEEFGETYRDTLAVDVAAAVAVGKSAALYKSLGQFQRAGECYVRACEQFEEASKLQRNSIVLLIERARMNAKLGEVRAFMSDQSVIPEGLGLETAARLLKDDPGYILERAPGAQFAFIELLHSEHIVALQRRGCLQLIGRKPDVDTDLSAEIAANDNAISRIGDLIRLDRRNMAYRRLGIRIHTDRARLELLTNNPQDAMTYLSIAGSAVDDELVGREARWVRSRILTELSYILCLAPEPIEGPAVSPQHAVECLEQLVQRLKTLIARKPDEKRPAELLQVAEERLVDYTALAE